MRDLDRLEAASVDTQASTILASITDGCIAVDNGWLVTYVNPAAERLLRCEANVVVGRKNIFELLGSDLDDPFRVGCIASKQSATPVALSANSGNLAVWFEAHGYPHAGGYAVVLRDVTEIRRAYRATLDSRFSLERERAIKQRIFDTSLDLILVSDSTGNLVDVSPSSMAILGYRPEEMIGRSAIGFVFDEDLENTRNEMRAGRRGQRTRNFDCRYVHQDGRVVTLAWTGVWSAPEQQHFFIGRDMTERIAAEERLRRSQRLEAIGQLTGGIAHDFNNLLTVTIGNIESLQPRIGADKEAAALAEAALKASLRGADLTRQLLAFARRQPLNAKVISIDERVSATMDLLRRTLGEQIEIATVSTPELWPALVDPVQFESALVNLSINARDAMQGGGRLTIEAANRQIDETYVRDNLDVTPGDYVMVAVSDTGSGMAPEVLARVFEPFFTTKPLGEGTGLGLSMVYGFIRQSHGHIKIYSELGHGTTVRLYLPRAAVDAVPDAVAEAAINQPAKHGERILLVEDNGDVRKIVALQLRQLGYDVVEAEDGVAALRILESGEMVDLLFTDIVMPGGMSGGDLARAAQALRPKLKVLFTSGFAEASMQTGARSDAFKSLLSKPYRKVELAAKLRAILDSQT